MIIDDKDWLFQDAAVAAGATYTDTTEVYIDDQQPASNSYDHHSYKYTWGDALEYQFVLNFATAPTTGTVELRLRGDDGNGAAIRMTKVISPRMTKGMACIDLELDHFWREENLYLWTVQVRNGTDADLTVSCRILPEELADDNRGRAQGRTNDGL